MANQEHLALLEKEKNWMILTIRSRNKSMFNLNHEQAEARLSQFKELNLIIKGANNGGQRRQER